MAWEQLSVNKPHLAYLILGGFTSLFMLCSLFVKERLYIGEATVAALCGVIFGPHAANIFNPLSWGNTDQITLECSRVVLVVQCFAVGVELPKAYMERHWRSVTFLLVPVMTFGWLMTSLFVWWMIEPLTWLESLMCAACVTATDPVLASSVVGKGKFAKRVPKHLRDLLSAESGCNDGMAFPFIYLSFYLIHYHLNAREVTFHWFCNAILYECVFGAIYGVLIGYGARHAIKWADRRNLIDRESFLVFYFVLALFCAGTGATLGTDDLLVGFAAGVGFSNDGWFTQKTEESHVSNVIDLLLNLAYFVYLGAIIPWEQYNNPLIGLTPWRLVVIAIFVIFFRRIPIMMALKPFIPDIKTWREALFAGHFGPIGVGAIFAAILARAELETDTTTPLADVPTDPNAVNYAVIQIIWPLTTFLVVTSILVHGSSIAVFTLGKRINQFTLTMSYTQANEEGPTWMNRLPRIASRQSVSKGQDDFSATSSMEKPEQFAPGTLPPIGMPGNFLRRQREEDTPIAAPRPIRAKTNRTYSTRLAGGHVEQSAIGRRPDLLQAEDSVSDTLNEKSGSPSSSSDGKKAESPDEQPEMSRQKSSAADQDRKQQSAGLPELEVYEEGDDELVVEDEEGNVVGVHRTKGESDADKRKQVLADERKVEQDSQGRFAHDKQHPHAAESEGDKIEDETKVARDAAATVPPGDRWRKLSRAVSTMSAFKRPSVSEGGRADSGGMNSEGKSAAAAASISGQRAPGQSTQQLAAQELKNTAQAAHAYQFGNTLIVEDGDGEVIRKIDLGPRSPQEGGSNVLQRVGDWASSFGGRKGTTDAGASSSSTGGVAATGSSKHNKKNPAKEDPDARLRFTVPGGKRMNKAEFIKELQAADPRQRKQILDESSAPPHIKEIVHEGAENLEKSLHALRPEISRTRSDDPTKPAPGKGSASFALGPVDEEDGKSVVTQPPTDDDDGEHAIIRRVDTFDEDAASAHRRATRDGRSSQDSTRSSAANSRRSAPKQDHSDGDSGHLAPPPDFASTFRRRIRTETAANERRAAAHQDHQRRLAELPPDPDSEDDGTERITPEERRAMVGGGFQGTATKFRNRFAGSHSRYPEAQPQQPTSAPDRGRDPVNDDEDDHGETRAERRRRLAALGEQYENDDASGEAGAARRATTESDSEDDGGERQPPGTAAQGPDIPFLLSPASAAAPRSASGRGGGSAASPGPQRIRFADTLGATPAVSQAKSITWGDDLPSSAASGGSTFGSHGEGVGSSTGARAAGKVRDVGRRFFKR